MSLVPQAIVFFFFFFFFFFCFLCLFYGNILIASLIDEGEDVRGFNVGPVRLLVHSVPGVGCNL